MGLAQQIGVTVETADARGLAGTAIHQPAAGRRPGAVSYRDVAIPASPPQGAICDLLNRAGQDATRNGPLAWLRYEPDESEGPFELRLTIWPNGHERLLATGHPHGASIRWHGSERGTGGKK
ncbi:MAG: DUF2332 family protein [Rhodospirillaceae bacterium]|nr:MAG: DUF2332 family protein [Rhodospirillaceae bacterium]